MDFKNFKAFFEHEPVRLYPSECSTQPFISVCVQTYNHEKFITKCLDSILEQKVSFDYEILICEDDSNDKTRQICIEYAAKFPKKIRLFLNNRKNNITINGEATGNFTTLFNLFSAKGKFIAICEGDDFWGDPYKLKHQYEFMEANPGYSICYHNFWIVNDQDEVIESDRASALQKDLTMEELLYPSIHPAPLTIFFRNSFKILPIEITRVINVDIFIYTLLGGIGPGKYLSSIGPAYYRVHDNGIWSDRNIDKKISSKINSYVEIINYYQRIQNNIKVNFFKEKVYKWRRHLFFKSLKKLDLVNTKRYLIELRRSL